MKVLILRSNPIAPDPRVEKIARALCQQGWRVEVLGWDRTTALPSLVQTDFGVVHRLPIRARFGSGLGNLPQLLRWQVGLFLWLVRHQKDFQAVHACDFDTVLPALLVGRLRKIPLIYDIFDFYADHLRRTPHWIKSLIRKVDLWVIGQVDAVILVDDSRRSQIVDLADPALNLSGWFGGGFSYRRQSEKLLVHGDEIPLPDGSTLRVIHTPGHTPGSACFLWKGMLFSGDTLFFEGIGRCDLPGGDERQIRESIRTRLFTLPDETRVLPGHMNETTIAHERRHNPFVSE